jgi:hypothetical protein
MVPKIFDDTIVSATELKKNQKAWFEKAYNTPVSVTSSKGRNFVLINRELMSSIYKAKETGEDVIRYFYDLKKEADTGEFSSEVFPWAKYLGSEDRIKFGDELLSSFIQLVSTNNLDLIKEVISEWRATAEALTNAQFMDVVNTKKSDMNYTEIE